MGEEYCRDTQLWQACAGSLVKLPQANSTVCYFPQGHAEHCREEVSSIVGKIPPFIRCKLDSINYFAHEDTDDVFYKMNLDPLRNDYNEYLTPDLENQQIRDQVVVKSLSQSDVNNGGGFSVPRFWSNEMLPPLDYSQRPPVQMITATDIHGKEWKFRHIYRGTPRRHLLTTGWSSFVNKKKLMVGDSIVLVKSEGAAELRIGIRRKIRGGDPVAEELSRRKRRNSDAESLMSAVSLAVKGEKFEVVYYPRSKVPEFVVKASSVYCSTRIQWCQGMRFKMSFETHDRISLCMGTISSVNCYDKSQFPESPWRVLEVMWDENMVDREELGEKVSPWSVELVSNIGAPQLNLFSNRENNNLYWPHVPPYNFPPFNVQLPIPPPPGFGTFQYPNYPNPFGIPNINLPDMSSSSTNSNPNPTSTLTPMNPSSNPMNPSTSTASTPMNPSTSSTPTHMNPSFFTPKMLEINLSDTNSTSNSTPTRLENNLQDMNPSTSTLTPKRLDHEVENEKNGCTTETITFMLLGKKITVNKPEE